MDRTQQFVHWWKGAVIYQVYCRSYCDANADGVGDLAGITSKLEYIAQLNVDAVWITPFYPSPMKDMGYDVSNYTDVDPLFGNLQDFDNLLQKAHSLGLKVLIDLVLSHTSDQHPWFQQSEKSRDNERAGWYIWSDGDNNGNAPNNWLSIFGGSAWQWHEGRKQYFMHNFLASQPDLNLHNHQVQSALLEVVDFWCRRGVDGIRLDTVNFYFHDEQLRANPENPSPTFQGSSASNPYSYQQHIYDKSRPENLLFLEKLREIADKYHVITLGEVGEDSETCLKLIREYTSGTQRLHMCYGFDLLSGTLTAKKISNYLQSMEKNAAEGWLCHCFSNHDVTRHLSRWQCPPEQWQQRAVQALNILLCLKGSACLYQGEELALPEARIPEEKRQDPFGKQCPGNGRDGCRTPMPWSARQKHGGFSNSLPWLPVDPRHLERAVDRQQEGSVLQEYQHWIAWHSQWSYKREGNITLSSATENTIVLDMQLPAQRMVAIFALVADKSTVSLPVDWQHIAHSGRGYTLLQDTVDFAGWGFVFLTQAGKSHVSG